MKKIFYSTCILLVFFSCKKETKPFLVTPATATGMWTLYSDQFDGDTIYTVLQHPCMSNQVYQVLSNGTFKAYYASADVCYLIPGHLSLGSPLTDTTYGTWSIIKDQYIAKTKRIDGTENIDYGSINNANGTLKLTLTDTAQISGQQTTFKSIYVKQ